MDLITIKSIHVICVLLSFFLFFLRGVWMLKSSPILHQRWVRILPHLVDTLLLASAATLAYQLSISPLQAPWLMVKIIALLIYIALGTLALKRGKTRQIRLLAWLSALLVFGYMVSVAITHHVLPWQAY